MIYPDHQIAIQSPHSVPFELEFDPPRRLFIVRLTGFVDMKEILAATEAQTVHPAFGPDANTMWDLRHTQAVDLGPEDLTSLLEKKLDRDARMGMTGKIAVVVNRSTVAGAAALAKIRGSRRPGRLLDVFPTEKLAVAWIDAEEPAG